MIYASFCFHFEENVLASGALTAPRPLRQGWLVKAGGGFNLLKLVKTAPVNTPKVVNTG